MLLHDRLPKLCSAKLKGWWVRRLTAVTRCQSTNQPSRRRQLSQKYLDQRLSIGYKLTEMLYSDSGDRKSPRSG